MKNLCMVCLLATLSPQLFAGGPLARATLTPLNATGRDLVYDTTRDVLYMSVPSSAGFPYGNSVVTLDPATGEITHSAFVGSEPNRMAIAADGTRVYVGIDGANAFTWWEPATDTVGPLVGFTSPGPWGPYVVQDLAVNPDDPHVVVISKDDVASSATGDLEIFRDQTSLADLNLIYGPQSICFGDGSTLLGHNYYTSSYDLWKWTFDGSTLTQQADIWGVLAGATRIEAKGGKLFANNGRVADVATLQPLGTFSGTPGWAAHEPVDNGALVYFLGVSATANFGLDLMTFDTRTLLKLDSRTFANTPFTGIQTLLLAGDDGTGGERFAFMDANGIVGTITVPAMVVKVDAFQSNGRISQLTWAATIGRTYRIEWSRDLLTWTTLQTATANQASITKTFNAIGTASEPEFYRVVEQ
ncbi:MAG: hypothetical protein RI897_1056 [Verrucomicrobiota bacterium]|jgi:hypothetical protein